MLVNLLGNSCPRGAGGGAALCLDGWESWVQSQSWFGKAAHQANTAARAAWQVGLVMKCIRHDKSGATALTGEDHRELSFALPAHL